MPSITPSPRQVAKKLACHIRTILAGNHPLRVNVHIVGDQPAIVVQCLSKDMCRLARAIGLKVSTSKVSGKTMFHKHLDGVEVWFHAIEPD